MSEYISIRDDLYNLLDNMRIDKGNDKKTSFSDAIQELLDENKFLKEESTKLREDNQILKTIGRNTKPTKESIETEIYRKKNLRLQSESIE
jgi:predicted CopG family antitoxin